ncbi:hypothetical protein MACJ_002543 [Theileria orientalis]|uniref:Uncharacterized protein n=1 Tax=Theileria orientalis TaxID=68886 RepID=A0A976QVK8_THEOR|nr:hypothetical protein MACJ_002543 [Theileria orientalis]
MRGAYTFVRFLWIGILIHNSSCFELNIGKTVSYSSGSTEVTVEQKSESQNLYTHKLQKPLQLKEIWNGDKKIYLDPQLVRDQLLLSASVIWSFKRPSIVQLILEKASLLLLNEHESSLDVQAIFSEAVVTNIKPRIHSSTEPLVDVNLSNLQDYGTGDSTVKVTKLEIRDPRFKRYELRTYSLESAKIRKLLHDSKELSGEPVKGGDRNTETPLRVSTKDDVYAIRVYSYDGYPLLMEVLYTYSKRAFFGNTPEKKWHQVLFPSSNDPSFPDFLLNKLNYYACKNGFKYTIDIKQKTEATDQAYSMDNYCVESDRVETIQNSLKASFFQNTFKSAGYGCVEHTASKGHKFFVDHLMANTSVLQFPNTPSFTKAIRVYHYLDYRPYLIVFVDNSDKLHYYKYQNGEWTFEKTVGDVPFTTRFTDDIITLLDKLLPDGVKVTADTVVILTDQIKNYDKSSMTGLVGNDLSLASLVDNAVTVTDETTKLGSCVTNFRLYKQDLSNSTKIASHEWQRTDFNFLLYLGNSKINFYENNNSDQPMTMTYKKNYKDLYIFYFGNGNLPLLMCFDGNVFRPKDKTNYSTKWVKVANITKCTCESGTTTNNTALSKTLTDVLDSLNAINTHQKQPSGQEYAPCKLMVKYEYTPMGQQSGIDLALYKAPNEKMTLKPDGEYAKMVYSRSEVYYNKYDETNTPLLIVLYFTDGTKYYKMSSFKTDKARGKNISAMDNYTDDKTVLTPLLDENDNLSSLITYRIDQKANTKEIFYNNYEILLRKNQARDLESNGFEKYTHTYMDSSKKNKNACVLFNNDAMLHLEENGTFSVLDGVQKVAYKEMVVYHGIKSELPLLVHFTKQNNDVDYYYHRKKNNVSYWQFLEDKEYNRLLGETAARAEMHNKLGGTSYDKLVKLLQNIEFEILDTTIILAERKESYMKTVVDSALKNSTPSLVPNPAATGLQPEQTEVAANSHEKLEENRFSMYEHKIDFKTDRDYLNDKIELRVLLKTGETSLTPKYTEALLHKQGTKLSEANNSNREYLFFKKTEGSGTATALYTYFYGSELNPLLLCYGSSGYKLMDKGANLTHWVRIANLESCKFSKDGDNTKLMDALAELIQCASNINMDERPTQEDVDNSTKLFVPFTYRIPNPGPCNINIFKQRGQSEKSVFSNDPKNKNFVITHEEVFFNRYSEYRNPLLMLVHFESSSTPKKYYKLSEYENDKHKTKKVTDLPDFTTEEALSNFMFEYNDSTYSTVIYQIDHKDNKYNPNRVVVEKQDKFPTGNFTKYTHRPANNFKNKKSFVVNNYNILTSWDASKNKAVAINDIQNIVLNSVVVFVSNKTKRPLLVGFEEVTSSGAWRYFFEREYDSGMFWQALNQGAASFFKKEGNTFRDPHKELYEKNNELLITVLNILEVSSMKTILALIDKQAQYNKEDVGTALSNTQPKISELPTITGAQPDSINVTEIEFKTYKSANYRCFSQTIQASMTNDLKLLVPTLDKTTDVSKYTEAGLFNSQGNTKERPKYKTGQNVLYTYFYSNDPRPLLVCYEGKAYKPMKLGEPERGRQVYVDYSKWLHVPELANCLPNGENTDENIVKILNALTDVTKFTNPVMINIERIPRNTTKLLTETKTSDNDVYYLHEYTKSTVVQMKISVKEISSYRYFTFEHAGTGNNNGADYRLGDIIYQPISGASRTFRLDYMGVGSSNRFRPMVRAVVYYYKHDIDFKDPLIIQLEFLDDSKSSDTIKEYYKLTARTYRGTERMEWKTHSEIAEILKDQKKLMEFMDNLRYQFKNALKVDLYHRTLRYEFKVSEAGGEGEFRGALKPGYIPLEDQKCGYLNTLKFHSVRHKITSLEDSYLADVSRLKMILPVKDKLDTWLKFYDENEKLLDEMVYNSFFGDVYVYHYDNYNMPLLICFLNKTYYSKNSDSYYKYDWYLLKGVTKCGCEVTDEAERKIIVDKLNDAVRFLEILQNISKRATGITFPYMDGETIKSMSDHATINSFHGESDRIPTIKFIKQLKANKKFKERDFDIYWFSWYQYNELVSYNGHLSGKLNVAVNSNFGINVVIYYRNKIFTLGKDDIYAQRIEYRYDYKSYHIFLDVYTDVLLVYSFKVDYGRSSGKWTYLGFKTMNIIQQEDIYRGYYERLKYTNQLDFDINFSHPLIK